MNKILKARGFSWFKSKYPFNLGAMVTCCWHRRRHAAQKNKVDCPDCHVNWPANRMWEWSILFHGENPDLEKRDSWASEAEQLAAYFLPIGCWNQTLPLFVTLGMASCTLQLDFCFCMTYKNIFQLRKLYSVTLSWALNLFNAQYIDIFFVFRKAEVIYGSGESE